MRSLLQRAIEAALTVCEFAIEEWWLVNTLAWSAVIVFALWLDGWFQ